MSDLKPFRVGGNNASELPGGAVDDTLLGAPAAARPLPRLVPEIVLERLVP